MVAPTAAQLIALLVEIEDDPARRHALSTGWALFEAVRDSGLVGPTDIDPLAQVVGELVEAGLLRYTTTNAGVRAWPPGAPWNGARLQEHHGYRTTADGRADAERYRSWQHERAAGDAPLDAEPPPDPRQTLRHAFEQLHFVFALLPGTDFPHLGRSIGEPDASVLRRYVACARELADSTVLTAGDVGYRVSFTPAGIERVETQTPDGEALRGMAVLFRQLFANDEAASFARSAGVLRRHVEDEQDHDVERQRAMLDGWTAAQGALRGRWLRELALERGRELGMPAPPRYPTAKFSPEEVLSAYFYGEHIHWDRGRQQLDVWREDPLADAEHGLLFVRALAQLSAVYVGFSALVVSAAAFDTLI